MESASVTLKLAVHCKKHLTPPKKHKAQPPIIFYFLFKLIQKTLNPCVMLKLILL